MSGIMQEGKLDYQLIPRALKLCETHTQAAGIKFTHFSVGPPSLDTLFSHSSGSVVDM